jgi:hypothetical protein
VGARLKMFTDLEQCKGIWFCRRSKRFRHFTEGIGEKTLFQANVQLDSGVLRILAALVVEFEVGSVGASSAKLFAIV